MDGAEVKKPSQIGLSKKHVFEACHAALKRLQLDYLDLYYCHRPDPETPIEETVWAMHQLVMEGKILYWGTSEWPIKDILKAHKFAKKNSLIGPVESNLNTICLFVNALNMSIKKLIVKLA